MGKIVNNHYDKAENKKETPLAKLLTIISEEKIRTILAIIFAILGTLLVLAGPLYLKEISNIILNYKINPIDWGYTYVLVGLGAGAFFFGALFQYLSAFIISGVVARGAQRLRNEMVNKINHLPLNYFDTRNIGDVLSYVTNDVDIVGTTLNQTLSTVISSIITVIGVIIILFIFNWKIGLITIIVLPVILFILGKVGGVSQKYFLTRSETLSNVSAEAEEAYSGFNVLRVFNATKRFRNKFAENNYKLEKAMAKADYYAGISIPLMTFLGNVLFCAIALVGGVIVAALPSDTSPEVRNAGIATVVAAVTYGDQLIAPITQIATNFATLQQTIASAKRIFDFLSQENEPDETDKTTTLTEVKGNIVFDHVRFGYNADRVIIHDFCEIGKPGQKIAIVGPTGAGKTTMVNLLMRFYELNSGSISIEGVNTKNMNRSYVRGLFGMVLQDTWLFEGTIMENLKYSRPEATDEEVYAACKATHCDGFIRQQPGGYNHILNEDCGLAAGQKQLLTIARAMIQNAPMLILDEATSSVDTRTELLIQDAMDKLMKGRTSFVIAHRLSTIKNSDLIIVMKDGDVIETGNHDQLMEKDGFYAALYNSQFTGKGPQFS